MLNCNPQGDSNIFSAISATGAAVTIKALLLLGSTNKRESFECVVFRQEFDPIHNLPEEPPEVVEGRRTLEIKFDRFGGLNLESSIADQINHSIEERVRSRFKLEITSWIQLQNTEDGSMMDWYNRELGESPWFETLVAAREWVSRQEEARLANPDRPNTK